MKKLSLIAILGIAAAFTACSDDSSSAGNTSCLFKYSNGTQMCTEGASQLIDMLCVGSENVTVEKGSGCPSGAKKECPEGDMTSFYYEDGAECF